MMETICIYHGYCADGFTSAWAVWKALGDDVEYYPGVYGEDPPDVFAKNVLLVDFSYKRPVLEEIAQEANSVLILDHHKSAAEDLKGLKKPKASWGEHLDECPIHGIRALFDMKRSGAGITWDFFHGAPRPRLVDHVEDRDLWRFAIPGTREIQAAIFSYEYTFENWDWLASRDISALRDEGAAIERKHHKDVAELVEVCQRRMEIGGHDVPVASLPYTLTSDAGHLMAQGEPFACCYWDTEDGRVFSLRSADDGLDVSEIAVSYGGGGHKNAAGFKVPRDHELARA